MTDNEIIKALECCHINKNCKGCPQKVKNDCLRIASIEAIGLINRQKAEIERLQKQDEIAEKIIREQGDKVFYLQSENDRLTDRNLELSEQAYNSIIACVSARTEAVKEFAERLKAITSRQYKLGRFVGEFNVGDFNNLVKEMVGAESG